MQRKGFRGEQGPPLSCVYQGLCPGGHTVRQSWPPVEETRMKEKWQERGEISLGPERHLRCYLDACLCIQEAAGLYFNVSLGAPLS